MKTRSISGYSENTSGLKKLKGNPMKKSTAVSALTVAGALAAALTFSAPAYAADEQCYGVALKGQNDCKAGAHACAGHSTVNYSGTDFKLVPAGTCEAMKTPTGKKGMLKPMEG
jgi:uncharacterized membrane protein